MAQKIVALQQLSSSYLIHCYQELHQKAYQPRSYLQVGVGVVWLFF